jgi:hypothetical protein
VVWIVGHIENLEALPPGNVAPVAL